MTEAHVHSTRAKTKGPDVRTKILDSRLRRTLLLSIFIVSARSHPRPFICLAITFSRLVNVPMSSASFCVLRLFKDFAYRSAHALSICPASLRLQ